MEQGESRVGANDEEGAEAVSRPHMNGNVAACETSRAVPATTRSRRANRDAKRDEAAALAQDLASGGRWSDTFVPTDGTQSTPDEGEHPNTQAESVHSGIGNDSPSAMTKFVHRADPPPAYSAREQPAELPATPVMNLVTPEGTVDREETTDGQQIEPQENQEIPGEDEESGHAEPANTRTPLLAQTHRRRVSQRGWTPWIHKGRNTRQRWCRLALLVLFFNALAAVLVCALVGKSKHGEHSAPSATFVPTGPSFVLHETTRDIHGAFKLYEKLELTTKTGSIDITIEPQDSDTPAELILASDLGSITVRLSRDFLKNKKKPKRVIATEITSFTGAIDADVLLVAGGRATIETTTGSQHVLVFTADAQHDKQLANLSTISRTGTQKVTVTAFDHQQVSYLDSRHESLATGSLKILYPDLWSGSLLAEARGASSIDITGKDLEYRERTERRVTATRGRSGGHVDIISRGTGSITFQC